MRLSLILGVCVLLLGAVAVNADTIVVPDGNLDVSVSISRTLNAVSGFDRWDVFMTALKGPAAGSSINVIEGAWTIAGSTFNLASDTAANAYGTLNSGETWKDFTLSGLGPGTLSNLAGYGQVGPGSFVNFDAKTDGTAWGRTGAGEAFSSFSGSWFTAVTTKYLVAGATNTNLTRMARLYVPAGTNPAGFGYNGTLAFTYGGGTTEHGTFGFVVPEPATLTLLAMGLVGLLAYAWRKR